MSNHMQNDRKSARSHVSIIQVQHYIQDFKLK